MITKDTAGSAGKVSLKKISDPGTIITGIAHGGVSPITTTAANVVGLYSTMGADNALLIFGADIDAEIY